MVTIKKATVRAPFEISNRRQAELLSRPQGHRHCGGRASQAQVSVQRGGSEASAERGGDSGGVQASRRHALMPLTMRLPDPRGYVTPIKGPISAGMGHARALLHRPVHALEDIERGAFGGRCGALRHPDRSAPRLGFDSPWRIRTPLSGYLANAIYVVLHIKSDAARAGLLSFAAGKGRSST
jgi:hypothetical protein